MGMLDGLLGQVTGNMDIANLAEKVGLPQEQVEQAMAALGQAHTEDGDTVAGASQATGIDPSKLQEIVSHIGGEGALGQISSLLQGQEGGVGSMLGGLKSKLFG